LHERSDGVFEGEKGLAIGVDKDYPVIEAVRAISEEKWKPFKTRDGIITDREVAKAIHTMNKGKVAFRLVVLWWKERQGDLFRGAYHFY
jgi:hypothetical protein